MPKLLEYVKIGFVDHVVDQQTGEIVRQGTILGKSTLGYMDDKLAEIFSTVDEGAARHVIASRSRDPSKPGYGLGGGAVAVTLEAVPYTGAEEVGIIADGELYAVNMSLNGASAPDGTMIIKKLEE